MCLVDVFYPRLVHFWLLSAVGRDVENPVTDDGFDAAPVSHAFLQPERLPSSPASPPGGPAIEKAILAVAP
jgi:hypothetical protein